MGAVEENKGGRRMEVTKISTADNETENKKCAELFADNLLESAKLSGFSITDEVAFKENCISFFLSMNEIQVNDEEEEK